MTSKERVLAALDRRPIDRVPIQTYLTPEMAAQLMRHFKVSEYEDLLQKLGVDFRTVSPLFKGVLPTVPQGSDFVDEWGVGYVLFDHGHGGTYPEANYLALASLRTLEDVEAYPWPSPDNYDYSTIEARCDHFQDFAICAGDAGRPDILNGVSRGRGMEQVMIDIMMEDPVGVAIIDKRCDFYYEVSRRTLEAGNGKIDILCLGEDTGNQSGPMFPLEVFDHFFYPRLKRFIDLAHEFGCKAMLHSCGDTSRLQSRFIEMGLDILDAMQPEPAGMQLEYLKEHYHPRLAYCGLISTQKTLPFGSVEECRKEAQDRLTFFTEGGYIFSPAHCIQADNPLANVLAIYEVALGIEPGSLGKGT